MLPPNALLSVTYTYATRLFNALFGVNCNLFFCICKDPFFLFFMFFITNFLRFFFQIRNWTFLFWTFAFPIFNFYIELFSFLWYDLFMIWTFRFWNWTYIHIIIWICWSCHHFNDVRLKRSETTCACTLVVEWPWDPPRYEHKSGA